MGTKTILNLAASTPFTSNEIRQLVKEFALSEKDITSLLNFSSGAGVTYDELYSVLMSMKVNL